MRLSPRQISEIRTECGKGGLDAALLAAQLLEMVEKLQAQLAATEAMLASSQRDTARAEAQLIEQALVHPACPTCMDAQARAVLERVKAMASAPPAASS